MGVAGCGIATSVVLWAQVFAAVWLLRRDRFYAQFGLLDDRGLHRPRWSAMKELLKLGIPMGSSILIEVSGFTFMAIFIARLGATAVAGHQLAMNLVSLMFMVPLAMANATATLVAQRIGARDLPDAHRLGWHGLVTAVLISTINGGLLYLGRAPVLGLYTSDAAVVAAAMPLLVWVWWFHATDSAQTVAAFVLRSHRIATAPMVVYALAIWGVGIGGGYWLAFGDAWPGPQRRPGLLGCGHRRPGPRGGGHDFRIGLGASDREARLSAAACAANLTFHRGTLGGAERLA